MIKKEDFSVMRFNPFCDILKTYPELARWTEFNMNLKDYFLDNNKVLGYIIGLYSIDSPLNSIKDYETRKANLIELLDFGKKAHIETLTSMRIFQVNEAITLWFRLYVTSKFELYAALCESFSELMAELRKPITVEDDSKRLKVFETKGKLKKQAMEEEKDIEAMRKEIFNDHDDVSQLVLQSKIRKMPGMVEKMVLK